MGQRFMAIHQARSEETFQQWAILQFQIADTVSQIGKNEEKTETTETPQIVEISDESEISE